MRIDRNAITGVDVTNVGKGLIKGGNMMNCPWYLGFDATEECIKTCTITSENRDISICPESDCDDFEITERTQ